MRPISLAVDVANYVMLETGQPLHTFDQRKLTGAIGVRRARSGEKLLTLDGVARALDHDDLVVTDDSGPIALAGVMGGASTEISESTTDVLIEAAHWDPGSIARAARRHKLPSEAAKRFERGVDPEVAGIALQRCVDLLVAHGGARAATGFTVVGERRTAPLIALRVDRPGALAGMAIDREAVVSRLQQVGCVVEGGDVLQVAPPPWRPDLTDPADLIEEVVRLEGYERIPSTLPTPPSGRGLTDRQRLHRAVSRALAASGCLEVLSYPFVAPTVHDAFALPADDDRRRALRLANPLSDAEPELRTSLLPGLLAALARNVGRGNRDLAIYESGSVFLPRSGAPRAPRPRVDGRPSEEELAALDAALPDQPRHVAAAFCGDREPAGWWGPARAFDWSDAVAAAQTVAHAAGVRFSVRAADHAPWHPGRCAALELDGRLVGFAGELHPRVVSALSLPERTCAMELDLELLPPTVAAHAPHLSTYPPVLLDVALVVAADVAAGDIADVLRRGAGPLLEGLRLFDVYADPERVGAGHKSLAFAMTFRASDRTLTLEEATAARDAAVAAAAERYGAALRT
jgi:phenylalanyl-tRNA synthetase beta chain